MRTPSTAFKARTALNIKCNSINTDGGNDLLIILGIRKMHNSNNFFFYIFRNCENFILLKTYVNVIRENKTLGENFYNQEHIFKTIRLFPPLKRKAIRILCGFCLV